MNKTNLYISSAILGAFVVSGAAMGKGGKTEKCYGVAKAGKNDCKGAKNDCKGTSAEDNDPDAWKFVPKGKCKDLGGSLTPPE